jgi:hypothetical protein
LVFSDGTKLVAAVRFTDPELILSPVTEQYDYRLPAALTAELAIVQTGC